MSKRIRRPIDRAAFDQAELELQRDYHAWLADPRSQQPGTKQHRRLRAKWLKLYEAHGGGVEEGTTFEGALPDDVIEPCPIKNKIVRVDILDGDNATFLAGAGVQHVNLPRAAKFVDGAHVANVDRLGRTIRVRVAFERPKKERFKVALLSHRDNAKYTSVERGRKASFNFRRRAAEHPEGEFEKHHGAVFSGQTQGNGTAILEAAFEVSPAGGDKYKLVAWDVNGNVVYSGGTIETKRTFYYATFLADDPDGVRMNQGWFRQWLQQAYAEHHVELVFLGEEALPGFVYHNIIDPDRTGREVDTASARNSLLGRRYLDYKPFLLRFAFVDHCAESRRKAIERFEQADVNPHDVVDVPVFMSPLVTRNNDPLYDWRRPLWRGLGPPEYVADRPATGHEWFHSAKLTIIYGGGQPDEEHALGAGDLTLVPRSLAEPDAMVELQIDVGARIVGQADVRVEAEVVYMYRSVLGQTLVDAFAGITVQPARNLYTPVPRKNQLSSAIHECGHALGMCAKEGNQGLQHDRFYDFQGQHCWTSVAPGVVTEAEYHQVPRKDTGTCVMYGMIPNGAPNMRFCKRCRRLIRKLDLSGGTAA